ncbi:MAG: hypothetical protein J6T35_08790 [Bacteroidales bacterium]|nr:hypothetical protein [Bacteroidales bacterium]
MDDKTLFNEVFIRFASKHPELYFDGTYVYYGDSIRFCTEGFNLEYNLLRLTRLLNDEGELI